MKYFRSHQSASSLFGYLLLGVLGAATTLSACSDGSSKAGTNNSAGTAGNLGRAGNGIAAAGTGIGPSGGFGIGVGSTSANAGAAGTSGCGETALVATRRPVNVMVLLDRSLSMNNPLSAADATTRLMAVQKALIEAMTPVADHVAFGLKLFPDGDASSECGISSLTPEVPLGLGAGTVTAIDHAINAAIPNGRTPIAAVLDWAAAYFSTGTSSQAVGDRVVLLATDGAPNCNAATTCEAANCVTNIDHPDFTENLCAQFPIDCLDGANAQAKVAALLGSTVPVRTVVVGIPGSDKPAYAAVLDKLGQIGGLPNPDPTLDYFAVTADQGAAGLSDTFRRITTQLIVSCQLELKSIPPDPNLLNVYVDGTVVAKNATDGWILDASTSPPTLTLQGSTCKKLETNGAQSISIKYGCPTYLLL